jgi:hypothetical protein
VGVEPEQPKKEPGDDLLGFRNRLIVGAIFTCFYIATFAPRQDDIAAILSGVLGGAVIFLLLKEVDERRKRRRR